MRIKEVTWKLGRDFNAIMECEHCGATFINRCGYDDEFYHNEVIPNMNCSACGRNREGTTKNIIATFVYVGSDERLKGKTALVKWDEPGKLLAQFDDMNLPEAFGWHKFNNTDFKLRGE